MAGEIFYVIAYKDGTYYAKLPKLKVGGKRSAKRFTTFDEADRRARSRATLYPRALDVQEWVIETYKMKPKWFEKGEVNDE